jgi:hypothetical protein
MHKEPSAYLAYACAHRAMLRCDLYYTRRGGLGTQGPLLALACAFAAEVSSNLNIQAGLTTRSTATAGRSRSVRSVEWLSAARVQVVRYACPLRLPLTRPSGRWLKPRSRRGPGGPTGTRGLGLHDRSRRDRLSRPITTMIGHSVPGEARGIPSMMGTVYPLCAPEGYSTLTCLS